MSDRWWWCATAMIVVVAACREDRRALAIAPLPARVPLAAPVAAPSTLAAESNVDDRDYVGPEACIACHPDNGARWRHSLHATMTQRADGAAILGDFDGASVAYGGGHARFERDRGAAIMALTDRHGVTRRFRVTRTIGTRALQEYVGVAMEAADPIEVRLPWGYWRARAGWYPQPYYDSWFDAEYDGATPRFDAFAAPTEPWAGRCAWCHTTYPFALRLARPGVGAGPEGALATVAPALPDGVLPAARILVDGVACESCHFGGRAHAEAPEQVAPTFAPRGPQVRSEDGGPLPPADRDDPRTIGAICAQCHSTPSPRFPDGSAARNSSESLAMAAGACTTEIRCVDCHDPHSRGADSGAPDQPAHVAACVRCHAYLAAPAAAQAHAHHDPAVVSCLDCHLPRIVQGLGTYVRSHRVSSPTDVAMLRAAAPNACNLCHLDRSITWTARALAAWGATVVPKASWRAEYGGDLTAAVGPAWLTHREPYVRMLAAHAYARAGDRAALPRLVEVLDDPEANTRMWIAFAIEALIGERLGVAAYDPLAPPATRARQLAGLRAWAAATASVPRP